ncbi:MAG: helix-turn-helix transcriptional regulator [Thermoguttaceae bacterium]|jgi:ribosome-binding protein aMBF1 (putative translation factor)
MTLTTQLRNAIETSGLSLYRIAKDADIPYAVIHRFANGERQIKIDAADKLANYFGMKLTRPKQVSSK